MGTGVHIVSVGARTPVGGRAANTAAAVRSGISRLGYHPYMLDRFGDPLRVAMDGALDEALIGADRMRALAESALDEACEGIREFLPHASMWLGLPEGRPGWTPIQGRDFVRALVASEAGRGLTEERARYFASGNAAGLTAMSSAVEEIRARKAELAVIGGADSYIHPLTLQWLGDNKQLHTDTDGRSSFIPGEGAAFVVLASKRVAAGMRKRPLAEVLGIGTASEPNRIKTKTICLGEGLSKAVRDATSGLRLPEQKIGKTYCDLNGERYRNEEFAFTALRNYHPFVDANAFDAPADCWGDVGAASGPLFVVLAVAAGVRGYAACRHVLLWASSEGGLRAAVSLELPE